MAVTDRALPTLLARYADAPGMPEAAAHLAATAPDDTTALRKLYEETLPLIEQAMWSQAPEMASVEHYQAAFRELEALIAVAGKDRRHHFILIVPVADRPQHLTNILESLLALCRAFGYGGLREGRFAKVQVVIADDTLEAATVDHNRTIIERFAVTGLDIHYFGAEAQAREMEALDPAAREALTGILGHPERNAYRHKGASVNRNLAYLLANRLHREAEAPCLFYFVDSDEQFRVRTADGRDLVAVNYLYHLDRIFAGGGVRLLTGKVVGDPPVSPAVMAGNFLEDVTAFLEQMAGLAPEQACTFHAAPQAGGGDAAYHDMADLFGFAAAKSYRYRCRLDGPHDHRACFADFAARLDRFFDGEHPTRITDYRHDGPFTATQPARTVYTGNYVCNAKGLAYFVPFAPLRLRMAGPTLGRIIRAEIGAAFVSANLPLLHTRTADEAAGAEFRPGVERQAAGVDLSGEFERQFFGDVMLFSVETLTAAGYPTRPVPEGEIRKVLAETEAELRGKYLAKLAQTRQRLARARALFKAPQQWWNDGTDLAPARERFGAFFENIDGNFAEEAPGYRLICDEAHRTARLEAILGALRHYGEDRRAWTAALEPEDRP